MEQLAKQMQENEAMLRRLKGHLAQIVASGGLAPTSELAQIAKLEMQLANMRLLVEARELTAER